MFATFVRLFIVVVCELERGVHLCKRICVRFIYTGMSRDIRLYAGPVSWVLSYNHWL